MKLMGAAGLFLGMKKTVLAGFIGILAGGIYVIILLCAGKINRKATIAFGSFLAAGIWAAMMYGEELISWYLRAFGLMGA